MKHLCLLLIVLLLSGISFSQIVVKKVMADVAIDGQLEESFWDISNQVSINLGGSDNTASFGVLWDDTYLYIGVNVEDETLCKNGRQGWYDDGVELYIDGNYNQGSTFDEHDRLFVKPVKSYWIQETEERNEGVLHQWIETNNGYSMEFAIPWDNFNISPLSGVNIGFNIAINDDDFCNSNNSLSRLLWFGNSDYYKNPAGWGILELSNQSVFYSGNYISLTSPNGGDFCINNKTTTINWVSHGISNINIDCSTDSGSSWNSIATNLPATSGSFSWNVSAAASEQCLLRIADATNSSKNDISESLFVISDAFLTVEPLIPNSWDNFRWPYNAYYPEDANGINGHVGNACGHSSLARILHYWEFPIIGNNELTFTDNTGHTWSANFGETTYNYDNMPGYLPENSSETEYTDVATLFYHAATSMHDVYGSGGNLDKMSYCMSHYFRYKESVPYERNTGTRAEWIQIMKDELDNGRVLLVGGMTLAVLGNWHENNNIAGHWYHVDGYNEDGYFHVVVGYGNSDGYYDADALIDFSFNVDILTGLEPDLNGKELSLQSLNGGETLNAGQEIEIIWSSTNVSNIKIEYTLDNGENWTVISESTPASDGSIHWITPNVSADECKIKLSLVGDVNVYDKSDEVFSIKPYELQLISPEGGWFYIAGDVTDISWGNTPVSNIKIEYSINNGSNWIEIVGSVPSALAHFEWTIPNETSTQCLIKISDVSLPDIFDISEESFEIGLPNNAGGPYIIDDNTILLLHFDNDLTAIGNYSGEIANNGAEESYETSQQKFNTCYRINNSSSTQCITMDVSPEVDLGNNWTIDFWTKVGSYGSGASAYPTIFIKDGDVKAAITIGFRHEGGGFNTYLTFADNTESRIVQYNGIDAGKWYHIALVSSAEKRTVSLIVHDKNWNSVFNESISFPNGSDGTLCTAERQMYLGGVTGGSNIQFDGWIDEFRISNTARSFKPSGLSEFNTDELMTIYPNPTKTSVYINAPKMGTLTIYSLTGQKVLERESFFKGFINVSGLMKGIYLVVFTGERYSVSRKLIIE